jgi:hypothetical protein
MLDLPRYLLGVVEIGLLGGLATLGAAAVRVRLLPAFSGAAAYLATAVLTLALLIWTAEILGSFGLFEPVPYLSCVAVVGLGLWLGVGGGRSYRLAGFSPRDLAAGRGRRWGKKEDAAARGDNPRPPIQSRSRGTHRGRRLSERHAGRSARMVTLAALAVAVVAVVHFTIDVRSKLLTGMTGFDSTWYHAPFAAGFFQSGDTWSLHLIAPQFLAWFYPANAEIFHAGGMLAFGRDVMSPLLNLGWFLGCLVACWCFGKPYRAAPWSLALGAVALSLPVLSDQAGEARNDIVGIFFLLAAVAVALNAWTVRRQGEAGLSLGALVVVGLAAGLAAGTKLNFLLPAAVLVFGLALVAPAGRRWRALAASGLAALGGGGYWYLRNLIHTGNPLPWFDHLGPISLPAPGQALGGREGHDVLGYLTGGSVWSDWFLPGLHGGLTILWPLVVALALTGLLACVFQPRGSLGTKYVHKEPGSRWGEGEGRDPMLLLAGLTGFAVILSWLVAPTSASGPAGMPRGFESGLRYLAPALVLGLALLPADPLLRGRLARLGALRSSLGSHSDTRDDRADPSSRWRPPALVLALIVAAIASGYPVQRHYLQSRYASPAFAAPGLDAAFRWANGIGGARIATTSTRQYPLFGTDLSNHVQYVGEEQPHGGFTTPTSCRQWRRLLNAGHYDYAVTSRDRIEPGKPPYPNTTRWTEGLGATFVLRKPPTAVFKLKGPLDPSACR